MLDALCRHGAWSDYKVMTTKYIAFENTMLSICVHVYILYVYTYIHLNTRMRSGTHLPEVPPLTPHPTTLGRDRSGGAVSLLAVLLLSDYIIPDVREHAVTLYSAGNHNLWHAVSILYYSMMTIQ